MSKFFRDRDGRIVTICLPPGYVTRGAKLARVDWPTLYELLVCLGVLVGLVGTNEMSDFGDLPR